MFLLLSCILPVSNENDTAVTGAGEQRGTLNDASFRLDWEQSEVWETGGCVEMDLTNQGLDASEWRVGVSLDEEVDAWTWLDAGLSPDGATAVSIIDTAGDEFEQGATLSTRYCSEPVALPTSLSVWAITGDDSQPDQIGGTIEDSTGRVWVSWSDSGQRGGVDCLEMSVINVSASDLPSWTIAMSLADDTELVEAWNAYARVEDGTVLELIPTDGEGLEASEKWSGWVCLSPLTWPVEATLTTGEDGTDGGGDTGQ